MRRTLPALTAGLLAALLSQPVAALPVRDLTVPLVAVAQYDRSRLLGTWYELFQTPSQLEQNCHGTTAEVAARDDSRLTLKIACHKGSLTGKLFPLGGVMAEREAGIFEFRLVNLLEMGNLQLVVLWQAPDDSVAAIGAARGEVGWLWSKTLNPDPALLQAARQAMQAAGYRVNALRPVEQAP